MMDATDDDDWLETLREALAMDAAPPALVERALALWRERVPAEGAGVLRRWVAVLSRDSASQSQPALGLRDVPSDTRQMLFTADERDIDLRIVAHGESFLLYGQHLGPDGDGRVELLRLEEGAAPLPRSAALSDMGEFALDEVRAGTYLLTVRVGSDEIVLPPIDVGAAPSGRGA